MASEPTNEPPWTGVPPEVAELLERDYAIHEAALAARDAQLDARHAAALAALDASQSTTPAPAPALTLVGLGTPTAAPRPPLVFHDAADVMLEEFDQPRYDFFPLVAPGVISAIGGYTGAGKTPLVVRLIRAMLHGEGFAGFDGAGPLPPEYRIVYLTQESKYTFKPLLGSAGLLPDLAAGRLKVCYLHEAYGTGATWDEMVEDATAAVGPRGMLVVDTVPEWAQVPNEDDNAVMAAVFKPLLVAAGPGRSVMAIVHAWKSFDTVPDDDADTMHIRGAGAIVSNATIIALYKKPKDRSAGDDVRYLKVARNRFGDYPEPRYLELTGEGELRPVEVLQRAARGRIADQELVRSTILAHDGIPHKSLGEITGLDSRRLTAATEALIEQSQITFTGVQRSKKDPLTWWPATQEDGDVVDDD
jgi:hypothetical protein